MGRVGVCWDNAVVKSFFATLKTEWVHTRSWPARSEARTAIYDYIETHYNRRRRYSTLGYRTPLEHERLYLAATAAA